MIQDPIDENILKLVKIEKTRNQGFRLLLDNYQKSIYWRIRGMVQSHEDASDVMQNVLIKVSKSIDKFEGKSKLFSWLYRIATNESLSFLDREKRKFSKYSSQNIGLNNISSGYQQGLKAQKIENLLNQAMDSLPEKQQRVFKLRYYEEQSYKEMSRNLLTSEGALKASYHHAVKKIESYLLKHHEG